MCIADTFAQSNTVSTGGDATGSSGAVSYSIGQIDYTTKTAASGTVTEGVQQPYEISIITGADNKFIQLEITAYPNPVIDVLILTINTKDLSNTFYYLYDLNGKLLQNKKVSGTTTEISFKDLPQGVYFLKVYTNNNELKTFKIIKN